VQPPVEVPGSVTLAAGAPVLTFYAANVVPEAKKTTPLTPSTQPEAAPGLAESAVAQYCEAP
jgi:hypothetical protein